MNELTRRAFVRGGLTAGIGIGIAPELLRSAVAGQAIAPAAATDPYAMVDPGLLATIKQFPFPTQSFISETLDAGRKWPPVPPLPPPAPQPFERHIPGPLGAPDLRLVIVDAAPGTKGRPALLHIHGGGYVSGFAGQFNPFLQAVAQNCGCLVVSVDYRLAPETHFPGSLEDNYTALSWLYKNSDELGVDRKRVAIGGESAGGGHSAQLAIAARDRREIPILFQLLIYPALDDRTGSTRQVPPYIGQFVWNAGSNRFAWTSFLGVPAGSPTVPAGAVPARVENLAGLAEHLPPASPRSPILLATSNCINRCVTRSLTEDPMKYICLGYLEPGKFENMSESERNTVLDECFSYNDELRKIGHLVAEEPLQPANTAVTVCWKDGNVAVIDGPYAETKEQLGGIQVLEARDLNHAIQLISQSPGVKLNCGTIEIRPAADIKELIRDSELRRRKDTSR